MKKLYLFLVGTLPFFAASAQTTVSITADKDNTIYSESSTLSNGLGQNIFAGVTNQPAFRRALLHFNLSSIPANSNITAVTLTLYCNKLAANSAGINIHKATRTWGEGTSNASSNEGTGAAATSGDATWSHSIYSTTTWTTAGGDFSPTVSGSVATVNFGSTVITSATLLNDVQSFYANPASNFGWLIKGNTETGSQNALRFASANHPTASQRPQLTITYSPILPVTLKSFTALLQNRNAVLQWSTITEANNAFFEVEHSPDGTRFSPIARVLGSGNSTTQKNYSYTNFNISAGKHYYRLAQYDANGAAKYSQVVLLSSKGVIELQLQPNPTSSLLTITAASSLNGARFSVVSSMGQIVQQGTLTDQKLNVNTLASGQYWLNIETTKGEILKESFIRR